MTDILTKSALPGTPATRPVPYVPGKPGIPAHYEYNTFYVDVYATYVNNSFSGYYWGGSGGSGLGIGTPPWGNVPPTNIQQSSTSSGPVYVGTFPVVQQAYIAATLPVYAQPAQPGVDATPADLQAGWNSGAVSLNPLTASGTYSFSVPQTAVGAISGLASQDFGGKYQKFEFGIYCASGMAQVVENGVPKTAAAAFVTSDVFYVVRLGSVVTYWKNTTLLYTSTAVSAGILWANGALYMAGDAINNAALSSSVGSPYNATSGTVVGVLTKILGFGSQLTGGVFAGYVSGKLKNLTTTAKGGALASVAGKLKNLKGWATGNGFHDATSGVLPSLVGKAESGLLRPNYAVVWTLLPTLSGYAFSNTGVKATVAGTLPKLYGFATNTNGAYVQRTLNTLQGWASAQGRNPSYFFGQLSGYSLFSQGHQGVVGQYGFAGVLSGYSLSALGGAQSAKLTIHSPTLSASGTTTILGEAVLTAPKFLLLATGTGVSLGRAYLATGGRYVVAGLGGAQAAISAVGPYALTGHGIGGSIGRATMKLHRATLVASGTQGNFAVAAGVLAGLITNPSGVARLRAPRATLQATGHNVVSADFEAYSVTLLEDKVATTHYTNYPFSQIVRFGNKYYGIGTNGVYELAGNTFAGASILSSITTGESDMGETTLKRTRRLYLAGRMDPDIQVTVSSSEIENDSYTYTPTLAGARNFRVTLGRGIQARYLAYNIQNLNGQDFELNEIGPEVDDLRRTA